MRACRNNDNLGRLSCKIVSPLVFAHVSSYSPVELIHDNGTHSLLLICGVPQDLSTVWLLEGMPS